MAYFKNCVKPNRNTTAESLQAALDLLYEENQDKFAKLYLQATHDNNGDSVWYWLNKFSNMKIKKDRKGTWK